MVILKHLVPFSELLSSPSRFTQNTAFIYQICCQLDYRAADSILPCNSIFISQQILDEIFITHAILGLLIKIEKNVLGIGVCIYISTCGTPSCGSLLCHQMAQADVLNLEVSIVAEVHPCLCGSSVSVECVLRHVG
jgi:hypothetical protein